MWLVKHTIAKPAPSIGSREEMFGLKFETADALAEAILKRIESERSDITEVIHRIYEGLDDRAAIRRSPADQVSSDSAREPSSSDEFLAIFSERAPSITIRSDRARRLAELKGRARSEDDAIAVALGLELWGLGIQLLLAVERA
jgi:hypothetical protein